MRWDEFEQACPELAELGRERFERQRLLMLGTLRRNGWPRISPCELDFVVGELCLGMMWRSPKARDLLCDSRCVLHSCTSDKSGTEGDFKLYGTARDVDDEGFRERFETVVERRLDWRPPRPYHLFAIDLGSAGFVMFGEDRYVLAWNLAAGLSRRAIC